VKTLKDQDKKKNELIQELADLRHRLRVLERETEAERVTVAGSRPFAECHESFFDDSADAL
jgi:hypothetical protein